MSAARAPHRAMASAAVAAPRRKHQGLRARPARPNSGCATRSLCNPCPGCFAPELRGTTIGLHDQTQTVPPVGPILTPGVLLHDRGTVIGLHLRAAAAARPGLR